jgi:ribosomal-protein-alanine N-acetyltransferase
MLEWTDDLTNNLTDGLTHDLTLIKDKDKELFIRKSSENFNSKKESKKGRKMGHITIVTNDVEATKEQMTFFADLEQNETGIWWAICSLDNQIFYGAGGLNSLIKEHKKAEIGFWLISDYWGKGIMKEAMPLICDYGFKKLGLHRIEGIVETENQNCKNVMAKLDFQYEGTMKECEIKNGKFISLDIYAKVNTN